MKTFSASEYKDLESLFRAKSEYYESLFKLLIEQLIDEESYWYDSENDNYIHESSGYYVDEMITI